MNIKYTGSIPYRMMKAYHRQHQSHNNSMALKYKLGRHSRNVQDLELTAQDGICWEFSSSLLSLSYS